MAQVVKKIQLPKQEMQETVSVSIPGSGRFPGVGNGNLLQYICLKKSMNRGAWQAIVHGVTKESDMTE